MPLDKYFNGHGRTVMRDMQARHGQEQGKRVFYATAKKRATMRRGKHRGPVRG